MDCARKIFDKRHQRHVCLFFFLQLHEGYIDDTMETSKRRRRTVDYKALADVRLPRASRKSGVKRDKLYPVKVVDKNSDNGTCENSLCGIHISGNCILTCQI